MTHEFQRLIIGVFATRFKCLHCGLKAVSAAQAEKLEGEECF